MGEVRVFRRERVIEQVLAERHPVLIEAGGGFGKTVLVEQIADTAGDAIRLRLPRGRPVTRDELERRLLDAATRDGADVSLDELLSPSAEPRLLVVDNAEMLTEDGAAWLADLAQHAMPGLRLVASARLLPAALAAMEFRGLAARFSSQDLLLSPEETAELAQIEIGPRDAERLAPTLHELSDGWLALLLLMLRRLARAPDRKAAAADLFRNPGLVRQLVDHYANQLDPDDRDLLVQFAHFPMVNESLLDGLGAQGVLRRLVHAGVPFAVGADGWWRLCAKLQLHLASLAPFDAGLARRAAPLFVAEGLELAAASVLAGSGDPASAVQLLAQLPPHRLHLLDPTGFIALMHRLGPAATAEPRLLVHLARAHSYVGQLAEERDAVVRALRVARASATGEDDELTVELEALWLVHRALRGDPEVLAEIEEQLERTPPGTDPRATLLEALGVALSTRTDEGSLRRAENAMREAAIAWSASGEPLRMASVQRTLAVRVLAPLGKTGEAAALLRRLAAAGETPYDRMLSLVYEARLLALGGEGERAEASLNDALPLAELLEIDWVIGHAAWTRMIVGANDHDEAKVLEELGVAESHLGQLIHGGRGLLFLCEAADACAVVGAEAPSLRLLAAAQERRSENRVLVAFTEALLAARGGDPDAADTLDKMISNDDVVPGLHWKALLLSGYARHASGDSAAGNRSLQHALELGASLGHPDLVDRRERRVVAALRAAMAARHDDGRGGDGDDDYSVQVLGGFEVVRGRSVLSGSGRASELVKHLALAGGSATVDGVVEALWPGEAPGVGQRRLKNVLARVRTAYGELVRRHGRRLVLSASVDLDHFEEMAREVAVSTNSERVARARKALEGFTGPLLPDDVYDDRIAQRRESVRQRALGLVDVVLAANLEAAELAEAVANLEAAMELDPYDQERPLRVARALMQHGRELEARRLAARVVAAADEVSIPTAIEWHELAPAVFEAGGDTP